MREYPQREIFAYGQYIMCQILNWESGEPPKFLICNPLDGRHHEPFLAKIGLGTWMRVDLTEALSTLQSTPTAGDIAAEREACCAAICDGCREKLPFSTEYPHLHEDGWISSDGIPSRSKCEAAAIRARGPGVAGERELPIPTLELAEAMWQLLDDMGKNGLCVSGFAKARARIAFEPFISEKDDLLPNPEWMTLERALLICDCVDRGVPVPPESPSAGERLTMGVGDGSGKLFVHGDYDSIKAAQAIVLERDRLREALEAIRKATLEGRVCDDVAWFDSITTLHDYICGVLDDDSAAAGSTGAD